jgi:dCTP deaminase
MTQKFPSHKSLLSRPRILSHFRDGSIVIDPFVPENLGTGQYDVTLGVNFYREVAPTLGQAIVGTSVGHRSVGGFPIYNPFSEEEVTKNWTLQKAHHHKTVVEKLGWSEPIKNIGMEDRIILILPGETILAHTQEFIGSNSGSITSMMKARSSTGRNFIEVCKCAGMGDHGYCNRWTMEITNNSQYRALPLVVGRRIGQLIFFETDALESGDDYVSEGKYQGTSDLSRLKAEWEPTAMLPQQWRDREVRQLNGE